MHSLRWKKTHSPSAAKVWLGYGYAMDEIWWNPEMLHVGGGKVDIPIVNKSGTEEKVCKEN